MLIDKSGGGTIPSVQDLVLEVVIRVDQDEESFHLDTDESYTLKVSKNSDIQAFINAPTFLGARHALETLFQLMEFDRDNQVFLMVDSADIADSPFYSHRGLLLDTGHNFIPVPLIKQLLDSLSFSKMNVFHWHISDSQSFPLQLDSYPDLAQYGSLKEDHIYTKDEVLDIVEYARDR